jgi:osmotically-inducible protein OsmY
MRDKMRRKDKYTAKSDEELTKAVKDAFRHDPRVSSFAIDAEVTAGIAHLKGTVDNLKAKKTAQADALNTIGVSSVSNHIKVRPVNPPSDAVIQQQVQASLNRNAMLYPAEISVLVRNHKVLLNGSVATYYEKEEAEDIVSRVPGVAEVQNNLGVNYTQEWKSDNQIKLDIESQFFWSPFVDAAKINVSVANGVATLTGEADSLHDITEVTKNAFEGGAQHVISKITIKGGVEPTSAYNFYYPSYYKTFSYPSMYYYYPFTPTPRF